MSVCFTIKPYELTNNLGNVIAVLQEYNFEKRIIVTTNFPVNYTKQKRVIGLIVKRQKPLKRMAI